VSLHIVVGRSPRAAAASFVVSANRGWPFCVKVDCAVIEVEFFILEKAAVFAGRPFCFIVSGCSKSSPSRTA